MSFISSYATEKRICTARYRGKEVGASNYDNTIVTSVQEDKRESKSKSVGDRDLRVAKQQNYEIRRI